jgi:hypothetical protein
VTKTSSISVDVNAQNFYAPFVVDPGAGDRVLYGTNRVWETTNGGDTWATISTVNTGGFNNGGNNVDAIGLAPSDLSTVYAATGGSFASTSQIFVTLNHGTSWTERDLPVTGRVSDLQVDPANAQIAYATINRFNGTNGQVYKTVNGGATWTNVTGNLPAIPAWSLQIDSTGNRLFVGADDGVYMTMNGGTTWSRFGAGLPNAQVFQIELNAALNILTAATHGRSAWQISTSAAVPATVNHDFNGDVKPDLVAQNASGQVVVWYFSGAQGNQFLGGNWLAQGGLSGYTVVGIADFNGDGKPDVVAQNGSGQIVVFYFGGAQGNTSMGQNFLSQAGVPGWTVVAIADFNGDGKPDLVAQNASGQIVVWYFGGPQGNTFLGFNWLMQFPPPGGWVVVGANDFNGDGKPDLIAQNASGQILVWYFGGAQGNVFLSGAWLSQGGAPGWTVVGSDDFNGDGRPDLVAENSSGQVVVWYFGGALGNIFQSANWLFQGGVPGWIVNVR